MTTYMNLLMYDIDIIYAILVTLLYVNKYFSVTA